MRHHWITIVVLAALCIGLWVFVVFQSSDPVITEEVAQRQRTEMVEQQLRGRDIVDEGVLQAMGEVPRHRFVPELWRGHSYQDRPLPIGHDQTISQPYIVALMTQLAMPTLKDKQESRALDVGTGSGYQAAILGQLFDHVYSIEIVQPLAEEAKQRLQQLGYDNVTVRHGDGYQGWPEHAPFDVIVVAASPDHVPPALIKQLTPRGRLIIPVENENGQQHLLVIAKQANGSLREHKVIPVRFVPMTGEAQASKSASR